MHAPPRCARRSSDRRRRTAELDVNEAGAVADASERGVKVGHLVRDIVTDAVEQRGAVAALDARALADRLAADVAEVRRRLAG